MMKTLYSVFNKDTDRQQLLFEFREFEAPSSVVPFSAFSAHCYVSEQEMT